MAVGDKLVNTDHARAMYQILCGEINDLKSAISEPTRNLWLWGDQIVPANGSSTQIGIYNVNIPAGPYTLSALVEREGSANCRMVFYKDVISSSSANMLANPYIAANARNSVSFSLSDAATIIVLYSGPNATANVTSTWKDIQIESGNIATPYVKPYSAIDIVARETANASASQADALNNKIDSTYNTIKNAIGVDDDYIRQTITAGDGYGNGKFWNSENTTAVLGSSANYYCYQPISVAPGEQYRVEVVQGSSPKQDPVLVVDSNLAIRQRHRESLIGPKTFFLTIPDDGAYLLITTTVADYASTALYKNDSVLTNKLLPVTSGILSLEGKTVAIIGDSISTNGDYDPDTNPYGNVPEMIITEDDVGTELSAYLTQKDVDGGLSLGGQTFTSSQIGTEVTFTPGDGDVGKMIGKPANYNASSVATWWEIVQELAHFTTIPVCWSGASMTSHEGSKNLYKTSYAWHDATIRKCGIRTPGGSSSASARTAPDVVIIFRGVNDLSHPESQSADPLVFRARAKVTEGEIGAYPGTYPETDKAGTSGAYKFGLAEAIEITVKKLREAYPHTIVVLCTINSFIRLDVETYPMNNGINTLPEYNETIRKVANVMGCPLIEFDKDGITFENVSDYTVDLTHPNAAGHTILAKRAMIDLAKINEFAVD